MRYGKMYTQIVIIYYSIIFCDSQKKVDCKRNMCIISPGYVFLILDTYHHDILYMNKGVRITGYISRRKRCRCSQKFGMSRIQDTSQPQPHGSWSAWPTPDHTRHWLEGLWLNPWFGCGTKAVHYHPPNAVLGNEAIAVVSQRVYNCWIFLLQ
jgi:hypothetical protein